MAKEDTLAGKSAQIRTRQACNRDRWPESFLRFSPRRWASACVAGLGADGAPTPVPPAAVAAPSLSPRGGGAARRHGAGAGGAAGRRGARRSAGSSRVRAYAPFWTEPGSARAAELAAALDASAGAGAAAGALRRRGLRRTAGGAAIRPRSAAREVAATRAYLRFATDLSKGVLTPSAVVEDITRKPAGAAAGRAARRARDGAGGRRRCRASSRRIRTIARLMAEKTRLELMGRTGAWGPAVAEGPTLHPGDERPAGGRGAGAAGAARLSSCRRPRWRRPASTTA